MPGFFSEAWAGSAVQHESSCRRRVFPAAYFAPGPSRRDERASTGNDIQHVADIEEMRMTWSLMARRCMWFGLVAMAFALAPASQAQDFDPENPYTVEAD